MPSCSPKRPDDLPVLARLARREGRHARHAARGPRCSRTGRSFRYRRRPAGSRRRGARRARHDGPDRPRTPCRASRYRSRRRPAGRRRRSVRHLLPQDVSRPLPPCPGTKPSSSPPTRAAAVCSTLKPFQSSWIRLKPVGELTGQRVDRRTVGAAQRAGTRGSASAAWRSSARRLKACLPSTTS